MKLLNAVVLGKVVNAAGESFVVYTRDDCVAIRVTSKKYTGKQRLVVILNTSDKWRLAIKGVQHKQFVNKLCRKIRGQEFTLNQEFSKLVSNLVNEVTGVTPPVLTDVEIGQRLKACK